MMRNKELKVQVICSNCGMPQILDVPILNFSKLDDHSSHFNTCSECNKWIISFQVIETSEIEDEERTDD